MSGKKRVSINPTFALTISKKLFRGNTLTRRIVKKPEYNSVPSAAAPLSRTVLSADHIGQTSRTFFSYLKTLSNRRCFVEWNCK